MAPKQGDNSGDINKIESGEKAGDASEALRDKGRPSEKASYDDSKQVAEKLNGPINTWLPSEGEKYESATAAKVADFKNATPEQQVAKLGDHTKSIESVKSFIVAINEKCNMVIANQALHERMNQESRMMT